MTLTGQFVPVNININIGLIIGLQYWT